MTMPAFLEHVDADEIADLEAVLEGYPNAEPLDNAQLDAVASEALRAMVREGAELDRYDAAEKAELRRIEARYDALRLPHGERFARAEELVKECARRAEFVGKAKSRKVGNGTYGKKLVPERVTVVDKVMALAFAKSFGRTDLVRVKTEETVIHSTIVPFVLDTLKMTGCLPEGFEHVSEHEEYFARPLGLEDQNV